MAKENDIVKAFTILSEVLSSPNRCDSNWEPANIVDVIGQLADSINNLARAIANMPNKKGE